MTQAIRVNLPADEYAAAKNEAARLGMSLEELLRQSLRCMLTICATTPWMGYVGIIESGDPISSRRLDEIVYG